MDYIQQILGMIDFESIRQLDLKIKGPAMALVAFFLFRAFRSIFSFSPIALVMSLVYALAITVILSQWGQQIQAMALPAIESWQNQESTTPATTPEATLPQTNILHIDGLRTVLPA